MSEKEIFIVLCIIFIVVEALRTIINILSAVDSYLQSKNINDKLKSIESDLHKLIK
jgi:hypothetical protein